tara:strand:+ start:263 stop:484 length:222 start_codon:yes stop_codon:yes gene_type:complete
VIEKITPETYEKMNKEFEEDDINFRINVPTQEQIDKWQSEPKPYFEPPPARDLVAEMLEEHNKKQENHETTNT